MKYFMGKTTLLELLKEDIKKKWGDYSATNGHEWTQMNLPDIRE